MDQSHEHCKKEIAEYVAYELRMMNALYDHDVFDDVTEGLKTYGTSKTLDELGIERNAVLESFLLHSRVLLDFLTGTEKYSDDIVASQFVDQPKHSTWERIRKNLLQKYKDKICIKMTNGKSLGLKKLLHKRLAHLTTTRILIPDELKGWDREEIKTFVEECFNDFLEFLPEDRKAWFVTMSE
ncbi:hypothetical protein [Gimesia fumaroli]|uniref:Uncharacterized protein n=1 Tax=Gimesia fumaroli TaxID=2527976 RepID=A0A518ICR0_9PLAN|nr:hypothetical protein [Gimesia fumaroli]QDV50881.1 hypothetical protein Enr17x_29260 [Gimesia fumaroli]